MVKSVRVNKPGAAGTIGGYSVVSAKPDGYTLGVGAAGGLTANVSLYPQMPFDVAKEMVRVAKPGGRIVMGNWIPGDPTLVAQILKISAAYTPPPPEGFISPVTWGVETNVKERFGQAGVSPEDDLHHRLNEALGRILACYEGTDAMALICPICQGEGRMAAACVQKDLTSGKMKAVEIPERIRSKIEAAPAIVAVAASRFASAACSVARASSSAGRITLPTRAVRRAGRGNRRTAGPGRRTRDFVRPVRA